MKRVFTLIAERVLAVIIFGTAVGVAVFVCNNKAPLAAADPPAAEVPAPGWLYPYKPTKCRAAVGPASDRKGGGVVVRLWVKNTDPHRILDLPAPAGKGEPRAEDEWENVYKVYTSRSTYGCRLHPGEEEEYSWTFERPVPGHTVKYTIPVSNRIWVVTYKAPKD